MKNFLKNIYKHFISVDIFESQRKFQKLSKKTSLCFIKSKKEAQNNKFTKNYFNINKELLKRFKKNSKFLGLKYRNMIICSGWIYFGKKWTIEEIDKEILLKRKYLLYDFLTVKKFRNLGFYKLLLKMIQNKFKNKTLLIYSLSHNYKSVRAIEKSGFKFIKKLKKL